MKTNDLKSLIFKQRHRDWIFFTISLSLFRVLKLNLSNEYQSRLIANQKTVDSFKFYESLGFERTSGDEYQTHRIKINCDF
jgi:hypothetical protein